MTLQELLASNKIYYIIEYSFNKTKSEFELIITHYPESQTYGSFCETVNIAPVKNYEITKHSNNDQNFLESIIGIDVEDETIRITTDRQEIILKT